MALSLLQTDAVGVLLKPGMCVASMGYPDIIAPMKMIEDIMGDKAAGLAYRNDSEAICKRHGLPNRPIPDAESFFSLMGAELTVYDVIQERGCEVLLDLNQPMLTMEYYDIVLDVGTVEHCFNIAQAIINMAILVKVGGVIIHENPFNCGNHGFYSLNPTFYSDFYLANGFSVKDCRLFSREGRIGAVPQGKRFSFTEEEANIFFMAERLTVKTFVYPVQAKYANMIPTKEAA